ncbi:CsbD family protein [Algimonas arctica]|uniref:CsbD family protein n=1 Tax=Algimonas arctica TaxID=1479486 RepID=A0A8J3CRX1_9PROT|nr:CsbD family protein [Algimonas arctica]GHA96695.1 CsbD family protein [Algimonas arctica]
MESEHIKAAGNKVKGNVKESVGKATDNKSLEAKGKADKLKAKGQDTIGDIKDALE